MKCAHRVPAFCLLSNHSSLPPHLIMKLRLNLSLRAALMACYAMAAPIATTLFTGALIAAPQALATDTEEDEEDVATSTSAITESFFDLGNVMYVGDSITHGTYSGSYRWWLHKVYADNGLTYESIGINQGNVYDYASTDEAEGGSVAPGTVYGGVAFTNIHQAESGATFNDVNSAYRNKFNGSDISNWFGVDTDLYTTITYTDADGNTVTSNQYVEGATMNNSSYSYNYQTEFSVFTGDDAPDYFFIMLGTNDIKSDSSWTTANNTTAINALLAEMVDVYNAVMAVNEDAVFIAANIPVMSGSYGNTNRLQNMYSYTEALYAWAEEMNTTNGNSNIIVVDVNQGMIDVTYGYENYIAVSGMLLSDNLHTSDQGNLIMAGNYAKALGLAGQTGGQERKAASELSVNFYSDGATYFGSTDNLASAGFVTTNVTVTDTTITMGGSSSTTSTIFYAWGDDEGLGGESATSNGVTVDFTLTFGNGETDGWNTTDDLTIIVGNDSYSGALYIDEAYISWGSDILYSIDTSSLDVSIRIAYINGDSENSLDSGYYVWLDDQLIGEALSGQSGDYSTLDGVTFTYTGDGEITITDLAIDGYSSYAPTTTGLTNTDGAYIAEADDWSGPASSGIAWNDDGSVVWTTAEYESTNTGTVDTLSTTTIARTVATPDASSGDISITAALDSSSVTYFYANQGSYTGNIWMEITEGGVTSWYSGHGSGSSGGTGTLTGSVFLKFSGDATGSILVDGSYSGTGAAVIGSINQTEVTGDVYLEFSAENLVLGYGHSNISASVAGAYDDDIGGSVHMVFNAGQFDYKIVGGVCYGTGTIGGATYIDIHGGTFNGGVYGGSTSSSGSQGGSIITGSGVSAINITMTAGTVNGSVYGGGTAGSITGDTEVSISGGTITGSVYGGGTGGTITGNTNVTIEGDTVSIAGDIYAGASGGTVTGNSTLTIKDLTEDGAMAGYTGTLSAGTASGTSTLIFDNVYVSDYQATITGFDTLTIASGSQIGLSSTTAISVEVLNMDAGVILTINEGTSLSAGAQGDIYTSFVVNNGSFTLGTAGVDFDTLKLGEMYISGSGDLTLLGNLDISTLVADSETAFFSFGDNNLIITSDLTLDLGTGLNDGTYSIFSSASAEGLDTVVIDGLTNSQTYSLSFDDETGILSLTIYQMGTMIWDDTIDSFGEGDTSDSYLELNSNDAALTVALSEDVTGLSVALIGSNEITISGNDLSSTGGISIEVSNLNFGEGGSLSGEMSFTGSTAIDAGNIDITATSATTIDGTIGYNSLSGDISSATVAITGNATMSDVSFVDSTLTVSASSTLTLSGTNSLPSFTLAEGLTIDVIGGTTTINGGASSYATSGNTAARYNYEINLSNGSLLSDNTQLWLASTSSSSDFELVVSGDGTYEVTSMLIRSTNNGAYTVTVEDNATIHITNTYTVASSSSSGFVLSGAPSGNGYSYVEIESTGTFELDAGIINYSTGTGIINVNSGGTLVLNRGTLSYNNSTGTSIVNVYGTIELGNTVNDSGTAATSSANLSVLTVNLYDGASIYGTGVTFVSSSTAGSVFTTNTYTDTYQTFNFAVADDADTTALTVNFGTASGSTLNVYSELDQGDYDVTLNVSGGTLNLAGGATLTSITAETSSTLAISSAVTADKVTADALTVTDGSLAVSGSMTATSLSVTGTNVSLGDGSSVTSITQSGGLISFTGSTTVGGLNTGSSSYVTNLSVSGEDTVVTVNDGATTSSASEEKTLSGNYTLSLADGATYSENSKFYFNNATMTVTGDGTYKQTMIILSSTGSVETTLNVGEDAVMEVTSSATSSSNNAIGFWLCGSGTSRSDVTIDGTLIINGMIIDRTGTDMSSASTITVNSGGTLQLNDGLYADSVYTTGIKLTVDAGGTLALGDEANTTDYSSEIVATMKSGSIIKAIDETTNVYTTLTYAEDATVTFDGNGNSLVMNTAVSGTNITAAIAGNVSLAGGATLTGITMGENAILTISSAVTAGSLTSDDATASVSVASGANFTVGTTSGYTGSLSLAGGSLSVGDSSLSTAIVVTADSTLGSTTGALTLNGSVSYSSYGIISAAEGTNITLGDEFSLSISADLLTMPSDSTSSSYSLITGLTNTDLLGSLSLTDFDDGGYIYEWSLVDGTLSLEITESQLIYLNPYKATFYDPDGNTPSSTSDTNYTQVTAGSTDRVVLYNYAGGNTSYSSALSVYSVEIGSKDNDSGGSGTTIAFSGNLTSATTITKYDESIFNLNATMTAAEGITITNGAINMNGTSAKIVSDTTITGDGSLTSSYYSFEALNDLQATILLTDAGGSISKDVITSATISGAELTIKGNTTFVDSTLSADSSLSINSGVEASITNSTINGSVNVTGTLTTTATSYTQGISLDGGSLVVGDGSLSTNIDVTAEGASISTVDAAGLTLDSIITFSDASYTLNLSGAGDITIADGFGLDFTSELTAGEYTLLSGLSNDISSSISKDDFSSISTDYSYSWEVTGNALTLTVAKRTGDVVWDSENDTWVDSETGDNVNTDSSSELNFSSGSSDAADVSQGDITLSGDTEAADVTFSGDNNMTMTEEGSISSSTTITKDGEGTLTTGQTLSAEDGIKVNEGAVELTGDGCLASTTTIDSDASVTAGNITVSGTTESSAELTDGGLSVNTLSSTTVKTAEVTVTGDASLTESTISADSTLSVSAGTLTLDSGSTIEANTTLAEGTAVSTGVITITANVNDAGYEFTEEGGSLTETELASATVNQSTVTVTGDASLTGSSITADSVLEVSNGALSVDDSLSISAKDSEGTATITIGSEGSVSSTVISNAEVSGAVLTIKGTSTEDETEDVTPKSSISSYSLSVGKTGAGDETGTGDETVESDGTLSFKDTSLSDTTIIMESGSTLNLSNVSISSDTSITGTEGNGSTLNAINVSIAADSNNLNIDGDTITITTIRGVDTVNISGDLTITMELTDAQYETMLASLEKSLTISLSGVSVNDALTSATITIINKDAEDTSIMLDGSTGELASGSLNFSVTEDSIIPEPSTTTLSLLALAGLLARRKRRAVKSEA